MDDYAPAPSRTLDIAIEHLALVERATCAAKVRAHCHVALIFLQLHVAGVHDVPPPRTAPPR